MYIYTYDISEISRTTALLENGEQKPFSKSAFVSDISDISYVWIDIHFYLFIFIFIYIYIFIYLFWCCICLWYIPCMNRYTFLFIDTYIYIHAYTHTQTHGHITNTHVRTHPSFSLANKCTLKEPIIIGLFCGKWPIR